ncbi:MAG: redoxin domain-containing protein [Prolixibacteraceae bacterium]|nr:redoxin domain-containing protein [Prolixibacteraceae bacterium]
MKKYLILITVIVFFACNRHKDKGFEIKVNLTGAQGKILLEKRGETEWIPVDTADIKDGLAVFRGEVKFPEDHYISVLGERPKTIVFVENSGITVTGHADSLETVSVNGSETHEDYERISTQMRQIGEEYMELYQQARDAQSSGDTVKAGQLMKKVQALYEGVTNIQKDFIRNNPNSFAVPYFLSRIQHGLEVEELDGLISGISQEVSLVPSVKRIKERVEKMKTLAIGNTAPDFVMNDPQGNPVRFSDIYSKNQYTLLDFWAAWCGPCRVENPNIVAVYNDYKDKGFGVFGVSLDRDKQAWLKAIEDDRLTWTHVSDLAYWNNAVARMYLINSIPSSLIVDRNGKIVAKNKRAGELREFISGFLD